MMDAPDDHPDSDLITFITKIAPVTVGVSASHSSSEPPRFGKYLDQSFDLVVDNLTTCGYQMVTYCNLLGI